MMASSRLSARFATVLIGLAAAACAGDYGTGPAGPVPGLLAVVFQTPNGDDGGVMFTISGGLIDSVLVAGNTAQGARLGAYSVRVLVARELSPGTVLARFAVPDVSQASLYSATLEQVASRRSFVSRALDGYALTIAK